MDSEESRRAHRHPGPDDPVPHPGPGPHPRPGPHPGRGPRPDPRPRPAKILVVGGPGSGKTTFLRTLAGEDVASAPAARVSGGWHRMRKRMRHVPPLELGRITLDDDLILYLFSATRADLGGQLWDEIAHGAIGAVVLADPRRLQDSFAAIDDFEQRRLPFIVAVNRFGPMTHTANDVREALAVPADVPVMFCDARQPLSAKAILHRLVRHTITRTARRLRGGSPRQRRGIGAPLLTDSPHVSTR
jgi:signal recognition particle receptor subunit beta